MMNRRQLLALTGMTLLSPQSRAQRAAQPASKPTANTLVLTDAPTRSVLELVLRSFQKNNFLIENNVGGLVSAKLSGLSFERLLNEISQRSTAPFNWSEIDQTVRIADQPGGESIQTLAESLKTVVLPEVEGIPMRVAGVFFLGRTPRAILERGNPPDSQVEIIELGGTVTVQGTEYLVEKITTGGLSLKGEKKTLTVRLALLRSPKNG